MISSALIGVATALLVLTIMAKVRRGEPKRAKKTEKAEIMKQLLALSEHENGTSGTASSVRFRTPLSSPEMRPDNATRKAVTKTSQPIRSNK
jgi:hypothetical protein